MCKYCEEGYSLADNEANVIDINNNVITFESFNEWHDPNSREEIQINFCPMCGRKLSEPLSDKEIANLAMKCNPNYDEPTHSLEYVRWEDGFIAGYKKALSLN